MYSMSNLVCICHQDWEEQLQLITGKTWVPFVGFEECDWRADCVDGDDYIHCTLSLSPAHSHTQRFFDIQESSDRNLTIPIMVGWQHDFAEGWVERQSIEIFPFLTYLLSFLYRFSNPVTLMAISQAVGVWYLNQVMSTHFLVPTAVQVL